jgi:xylulokinase
MAEADLVLGIDVGTSSVKAALFDAHGAIHASARASYPTRFPEPGHAEQDPHDWWRAVGEAVREGVAAIPNAAQRVAGIGIAAQMCGTVAVDSRGEPLHPCLIWLDTRSREIARRIAGGALSIGGYGVVRTLRWLRLANGAPNLDGRDPLCKILWLRERFGAQAARYLDVKDWLVHRCTGGYATTPDVAQLTWLMDNRVGRRDWSDAYLDRFGLTRAMLPEIVPSSTASGLLTPEAALHLGLHPGVPVSGGVSDLNASAIAAGDHGEGAYHFSLGTSAWWGAHSMRRRVSPATGIATICAAHQDRYLLAAAQENAGAAARWAAAAFGYGDERALDAEAARCTPTAATPLFAPWLYGERVPVSAREGHGALLYASLRTTRADLAYAVLAGVALNARWAYAHAQRLVAASSAPLRLTGGGARSAVWRQVFADVLRRPLQVLEAPEYAGARGAAMTAAVVCGWYQKLEETAAMARHGDTTEPNPARAAWADERYAQLVDHSKHARRHAKEPIA